MNAFGEVDSDLEDKFCIESAKFNDDSNGEGRGEKEEESVMSEISVLSKRIQEEEKRCVGRERQRLLLKSGVCGGYRRSI